MKMDVRQHQYAKHVNLKRKENVRERHVRAFVLQYASRIRSFALVKLIAMDALCQNSAFQRRKTTTGNIAPRIRRLTVVLRIAMRTMARLIATQGLKTYLDANLLECAYNAQRIQTVTIVLAPQLAHFIASPVRF